MKVYKVYPTGHQGVNATSDDTVLRQLAVKPLPSFMDVEFPTYYIGTLKEKRGNFFRLYHYALLFDSVAKEALGNIVQLAGESYALEVEEVGQLTFVNTLETCEEALDRDKTTFRNNDLDYKTGPMDFVFNPEKITTKTGLFKIPDTFYGTQYVVSNSARQEFDFYKIYHDAGLTGLKFEMVWEQTENC